MGLLAYSGLATKIRAMESRFFTPDEYRKLASCSNVPEAVAYLKQHPGYTEIFAALDENKLHRGDVERMLITSLHHDFSKIYNFCDINQRKLLDLYFCHYEVKVLKTVLRKIAAGKKDSDILSHLNDFFHKYAEIDVQMLSRAATVEELIAALKGTKYEKPFSTLQHSDSPSLFDYEMMLDLFFFSTMWTKKNKLLKGEALDVITRSFGTRIDTLNILWIARAKTYYRMPNVDIYAMVIPIQYKLTKTEIHQMVEASTKAEFEEILSHTPYACNSDALKTEQAALEHFYQSFVDKIYEIDKRKHPYSIAIINSYLHEKEQELDKLTTILECVRYGMGTDEALSYISLPSSHAMKE